MKFKEIKKETKRRIYALALAAIMVVLPKTRAYAEDINMSETIDIDQAIADLVPQDPTPTPTPEPTPAPTTEPTTPTETIPKETVNNSNNNGSNNDNENNNSKCDHKYNDVADDVIDKSDEGAPSCTKGGSYDKIYYCTRCGEPMIVNYTVDAPGHVWGPEHRENENELGYDLVRECTNKGCLEKWRVYIPKTPTETTIPTEPTIPSRPTNPDTPKTGDKFPIELMEAILGISAIGLPITSYQLYKILQEEKKQKEQASTNYIENEYRGKYLSKR